MRGCPIIGLGGMVRAGLKSGMSVFVMVTVE
jgi:hypothetical protein